jgi:hypothetical protein
MLESSFALHQLTKVEDISGASKVIRFRAQVNFSVVFQPRLEEVEEFLVVLGVVDRLGGHDNVVFVIVSCQVSEAVPVAGVEGTLCEIFGLFTLFSVEDDVGNCEFFEDVVILKVYFVELRESFMKIR